MSTQIRRRNRYHRSVRRSTLVQNVLLSLTLATTLPRTHAKALRLEKVFIIQAKQFREQQDDGMCLSFVRVKSIVKE